MRVNGKPTETIPHSRLHSAGKTSRQLATRNRDHGARTRETNRDPHRAVIPLAKGSRFGPAHKRPAEAGLKFPKGGLPLGGKPINAIAQSVAQCTICTSMSRLASHLCLPTQRAVTQSTKVTSKPAQSTGRLAVGCTAGGHRKSPARGSGRRASWVGLPVVPARVLALSGHAPGTHCDRQAHRSKRGASGLVSMSEIRHNQQEKAPPGAGLSWSTIWLAAGSPAEAASLFGCTGTHRKSPP